MFHSFIRSFSPCVHEIDMLLGTPSGSSDAFWKTEMKSALTEKFGVVLEEDARTKFTIPTLFEVLSTKTGVQLTKQAQEELKQHYSSSNAGTFKLMYHGTFNSSVSTFPRNLDIDKIQTKVKKMNFINHAEGYSLALQSMRSLSEEKNSSNAKKLFKVGR